MFRRRTGNGGRGSLQNYLTFTRFAFDDHFSVCFFFFKYWNSWKYGAIFFEEGSVPFETKRRERTVIVLLASSVIWCVLSLGGYFVSVSSISVLYNCLNDTFGTFFCFFALLFLENVLQYKDFKLKSGFFFLSENYFGNSLKIIYFKSLEFGFFREIFTKIEFFRGRFCRI